MNILTVLSLPIHEHRIFSCKFMSSSLSSIIIFTVEIFHLLGFIYAYVFYWLWCYCKWDYLFFRKSLVCRNANFCVLILYSTIFQIFLLDLTVWGVGSFIHKMMSSEIVHFYFFFPILLPFLFFLPDCSDQDFQK